MSHTPVKLTAEESRIYANEHFLCSGGNWLMTIRHNGEQMPEAQRENVRRLAAAWNACDGISTDDLESNPGPKSMAELLPGHLAIKACKAWLADEIDDGSFADTLRQIIARSPE